MIYILFILVIVLSFFVVGEWMIIVRMIDQMEDVLRCLEAAKKEIQNVKRLKM